jgi:hypothetical protein
MSNWLASNDMLVPGGTGRAQRSRGTCYVDKPPHGFFISGSSLKAVNGLYIRKNPPRGAARAGEAFLLYYSHMTTAATMLMTETVRARGGGEEEEDDEEDYVDSYWRPEPQRQWVIVDERGVDRFTHVGDTIVPGAGVRWKFVRAPSAPPVAGAGGSGGGGGAAAQQVVAVAPDDEDTLPWQVIAILDQQILNQLYNGARFHAQRVAEAMAGRGDAVPAPAQCSLEGAVQEGRWLYRVEGDTVTLRAAPSPGAPVVGKRKRGEYVRALEVREVRGGEGGAWLRLDSAPRKAPGAAAEEEEEWAGDGGDGEGEGEDDDGGDDEEEDGGYADDEEDEDGGVGGLYGGYGLGGGYGRFFNMAHRQPKAEWWAPLASPAGEPLLSRVEAVDLGHLGSKAVEGEVIEERLDEELAPGGAPPAPRRIDSLAGEFLDAPFVARLGGGEGGEGSGAGGGAGAAALAEPPASIAAAAAACGRGGALPLGAAVRVARLTGAETQRFNGCIGVVVTALGAEGRHGVRLEAPFAGKKLHVRPANLAPFDPLSARVARGGAAAAEAAPPALEAAARHARVLGLSLHEVGLLSPPPQGAAAGVLGDDAPPLGFRVDGCSGSAALEACVLLAFARARLPLLFARL